MGPPTEMDPTDPMSPGAGGSRLRDVGRTVTSEAADQTVVELVERVARAKRVGLRDLAMTTNGWNLKALAGPLRDAGLDRLNISIDTLRADRFFEITKRDCLDDVLAGIDEVLLTADASRRPCFGCQWA